MPYDEDYDGYLRVADERPTARLKARRTTYRGGSGYLITGTDTHGRRVSVFTPDGGMTPEAVKANTLAGRGAFDTTAPSRTPLTPPRQGRMSVVGTVEDPAGGHRPPGDRKLYSLRVERATVARAMERGQVEGWGLAELVEELLDMYGRGEVDLEP